MYEEFDSKTLLVKAILLFSLAMRIQVRQPAGKARWRLPIIYGEAIIVASLKISKISGRLFTAVTRTYPKVLLAFTQALPGRCDLMAAT